MSNLLYFKEISHLPHSVYSLAEGVIITVQENGSKKLYINGVRYELDEFIYGIAQPYKTFTEEDLQGASRVKGVKNTFWPEGFNGSDCTNIGVRGVKKQDDSWDFFDKNNVLFLESRSTEDVLAYLNMGHIKIFK